MSITLLDWFVLLCTLLFIVGYGTYKTRRANTTQDFLKGGKTKWWTIGLSVMATQASAITFLSTPGQAFHSGMGFVQFYFGLPIAMVVICLVFIPIFHKLNVFTAYEYLESRFDKKTRVLTAVLFLIQRGLAAGITIFAPSIILSAVLGWNLITLNLIIGVLVILYTVSGGTKAVNVTQKQQMAVIFAGMFITFWIIVHALPEQITFSKALSIAGASGKMNVLDFSWDLNNRYTIWTGILGGTFLMLSYFGTDQSQVQRYLSGKSVKESQLGLIFNGLLKVPMQFFILLVGVFVFVFYQFNPSPINFNPNVVKVVENSSFNSQYKSLQNRYDILQDEKKNILLSENYTTHQIIAIHEQQSVIKSELNTILKKITSKVETNDKDYVFIHFILNNLPKGIIGLLLAVILSAAMSSTASELNALANTTTIDLYKRNVSATYDDKHYVNMSKWFTLLWGILAISVACVANLFDNLIQLVNIIGSIFYGNVLGIFLIAFFIKKIEANAVFIGAIITQVIIIGLWKANLFSFLWLNLIGTIVVITISYVIEVFQLKQSKA